MRLLRQWAPATMHRFVQLPGVAQCTACFRGISYYQPPNLGFLRFPALGKMILVAAVCIGTIAWCFAIKPYYRQSMEWGAPPLALRAGILAIGLFPFLMAFGLMINPVTMLTGISHERLQMYHQWTARLFFFFALVHTIPFIHQPLADAGGSNLHAWYHSNNIYTTGTVAFALMVWIVCSSSRVFRQLSYEVFVLQHIATVIALIVVLYLHVHNLLNSFHWLYAGVAFWAFSIVARGTLTLLSSGFFSRTKATVSVQATMDEAHDAKCEQARQGHEILYITLDTYLRWGAGQHVYIRFPGVAPLENHPFTVLSLPEKLPKMQSRLVLLVRVENGLTRRIFNRVQHNDADVEAGSLPSSESSGPSSDQGSVPSLPYHSNPSRGHSSDEKLSTKSQQKAASSNRELTRTFPARKQHLRAVIDGPYGSSWDPSVFESGMFIAGGSGISFVLPIFLHLLRRSANGPAGVTKRAHLVWVMRSHVMAEWIADYLDELEQLRHASSMHVKVQLFVSRQSPQQASKGMFSGQRPDVPAIFSDELEQVEAAELRSMGVYVCGPRSLYTTVSNAVAAAQWKICQGASGTLREICLEKEAYDW